MPANNPFGYIPSFMPTPTGGIDVNQPPMPPLVSQPQMPGLQSNLQLPSLGSLIQPTQPGQGFDLMAALRLGNQDILKARSLANVIPNIPKPVTPAPIAEKPKESKGKSFKDRVKENRRNRRAR